MPSVRFVANIPQHAEDLNTGQSHLIADMIVEAIAYTDNNGAIMAADILTLTWKGADVTKYVIECQPETWERLQEAAKAHYLTPTNVTS
jgi:hypothetical protein